MTNNKRINAIDAVRGLAIIGMILSGTFAWNADLPAWMFHCQTPPPDYHFDPSVKGITWVDLVFPFFLFALGAAVPIAVGKKLDGGESYGRVSLRIIKRWVVIALFGLALGYSGSLFWKGGEEPVLQYGVYFATWIGMFMGLVKIKDNKKALIVNIAGLLLTVGALVYGGIHWNFPYSPHNNNIIIMVMSSMVLFTSFIWLLTRKRPGLRLIIWLLIVGVKAVCSYTKFELPTFPAINWLLNWRYMQYLCLVVPATFIGDILYADSFLKNDIKEDAKRDIASIIAILMIPLALWGFFTRNITILAIAAFVCAAVYVILTKRNMDARTQVAYIGWLLFLAGIGFDPLDGGITKDHCNLSYLFATGGLAMLTTSFFMWCEARLGSCGKLLTNVGQNPMIGYTICGYVIQPVLTLVGLMGVIGKLTPGSPFWGFMQGAILTTLMAFGTAFFTKKKIYWKS